MNQIELARLRIEMEKYFDTAVLVEGTHDRDALEKIGFRRIYVLNNGKGIDEHIEQIALELGRKKEIAILTDFDDEGRKLHSIVVPLFQEQGVRIATKLRSLFMRARVYRIEECGDLFESLAD